MLGLIGMELLLVATNILLLMYRNEKINVDIFFYSAYMQTAGKDDELGNVLSLFSSDISNYKKLSQLSLRLALN